MTRGVSPLTLALSVLAVTTAFTVSDNLLTAAGSSYVSQGGSLAEKMHPTTYLTFAALAVHLAGGAAPGTTAWRLINRETDIVVFVAGIGFCIVYVGCVTGPSNLITLLDTFLPAGMIGLVFADLGAEQARFLRRAMQALLLLNASIAVGEAGTGRHLFAFNSLSLDLERDFRPLGLYDHPLTGAAATMMGLFLMPDPAAHPVGAVTYTTLMCATLIAFGERSALAILAVILSAWLTVTALRRAAARRVTYVSGVMTAAVASGAGVGIGAVFFAGLAPRLQNHLYWDASAQTRLDHFGILAHLTPEQLLFGCRRDLLMAQLEVLRLQSGVAVIENFWILMLVTVGALCFPVFLVAMAALAHFLWRHSDSRGRMMTAGLFLAASASNSLGRKSTLLVMLVASVLSSRKDMPAPCERPAAAARAT